MKTVNPAFNRSVRAKSDDIPKRLLEPIGRRLRTGDSKATIDRLFVSQHVQDLRLIIAFTLIAVLSVFALGLPGSLAYGFYNHNVVSTFAKFVTFFTPVLGVFGAVLAWAYQTGSARLGIVDLFACEIDTLCRVALVVDSVHRAIEKFHHGLELPVHHFTSEENYFPVFENNTRDLQTLEAEVVVNITAFYTYMKAVRDSTRAITDMSVSPTQPESRSDSASNLTRWQEGTRNVVYMMFLGLESARKATGYLVEFEPDEAERTTVILISELEAYRFLREQFVDEANILYQRLELRKAGYEKLVPELCNTVERGRASDPSRWEPAWRLLPELRRKWGAAMEQSSKPCRLAATA
jgi:hypothetical protein